MDRQKPQRDTTPPTKNQKKKARKLKNPNLDIESCVYHRYITTTAAAITTLMGYTHLLGGGGIKGYSHQK